MESLIPRASLRKKIVTCSSTPISLEFLKMTILNPREASALHKCFTNPDYGQNEKDVVG